MWYNGYYEDENIVMVFRIERMELLSMAVNKKFQLCEKPFAVFVVGIAIVIPTLDIKYRSGVEYVHLSCVSSLMINLRLL